MTRVRSARLRAGRSGVRILPGAGYSFVHHCVHTGSGTHPASYPMVSGGSFPGGKAARGVKLITHLLLVPRSKNASSYNSTLPIHLHDVVFT